MSHHDFDTIYANVPADQREGLRAFRESHPPQTAQIDGAAWEYLAGGDGDESVLLLVGGLRVADAAWRSMPELEDGFRVITPTYPALATMAALADGLAGVLDAARVERAHVLAGSFGGMLAQVFARRHPGRMSKMILSTTTIPDPSHVERYQTPLMMIEAADEEQVRQLAEAQMFDIIAPPEDMGAFYRAYLHELYAHRIGKAPIASTYRCLADFHANYEFAPGDLAGWDGVLLILESDDDATFDAEARAAVHAVYPDAQTHTFHGAGHSPGTTQRELYFRVVKDFLHG